MTIDEFQISTPRLILRPHRPEDTEFMVALNSDPEVVRYVGADSVDLEQAREIVSRLRREFEDRRLGRFLVIEKATNEKIGWCGLKWIEERRCVDLGYRLRRDRWAKGYATEAALAARDYGFKTLGLEEIWARAAQENTRSIHVLEKLGMTRAGKVTDHGQACLDFRLDRRAFLADEARRLITTLELKPHPEGGYYRETYRSPHSTAIYFLLTEGERSRLHRIKSDELWHFYCGGPLTVTEIAPDGRVTETALGAHGGKLQHTVTAGHWFGAQPNAGAGYALVGCTVAPAFQFADFELGRRDVLLKAFPHAKEIIARLTA